MSLDLPIIRKEKIRKKKKSLKLSLSKTQQLNLDKFKARNSQV